MKTKKIGVKITTILKISACFVLTSLSFNLFAGEVYIGNPVRPHTIWVPGQCSGGCWVKGHYLKALSPVYCDNLVWINGYHDSVGNYIPAHYQFRNYVVINPGSANSYPGF